MVRGAHTSGRGRRLQTRTVHTGVQSERPQHIFKFDDGFFFSSVLIENFGLLFIVLVKDVEVQHWTVEQTATLQALLCCCHVNFLMVIFNKLKSQNCLVFCCFCQVFFIDLGSFGIDFYYHDSRLKYIFMWDLKLHSFFWQLGGSKAPWRGFLQIWHQLPIELIRIRWSKAIARELIH